jgi:hypothetical protein
MSTDPAAMVKEGVRLYKANKKAEARSLWEQVTELDPYNEQAWLWLSAVVDSVDDQRVCLENVLYINPDNPNAKKGLAALDAKNPSATGATSNRPAGTAPLTSSFDSGFDPAPPIATSSASSTFTPEPTAPEVYDDWIGSLNLPGTGTLDSSQSDAGTKKPGTSPFTTTDFDSFSDFGSGTGDDNIFAGVSDEDDSFEIYTPSPQETTGASYSSGDDLRAMMSMDDDDDVYSPPSSSSSASSRGGSSAPAFASSYDDSDDDDDVFGDDFAVYTPPSASSSSRTNASEYDLGDDPFSDNPFPNAAPAASSSSPFTSDDLDFETDSAVFSSSGSAYGLTSDDEMDPGEYFAMIPASIKARSLPGSDEKYPLVVRLLFILLLLLNMGAIILLIVQFAG